MDSQPDEPEHGELADLTRALGAQVRRARARGQRRSPRTRAAAATPVRSAPAAPADRPAAPVRFSIAAQPHAAPQPASARPAPAPAPVPAPRPAVAAAPRPAAVATNAAAERVRAVAASCQTLDELRAAVSNCTECSLCRTRTQTVFQDGAGASGVLFIGEAPGADEDRTGVPFVGRAGQLLTDIITKGMGLPRADVWIANVLKCRPPDNREPTPAEKTTCTPFLDRQIELMQPRVIIPLGRHAAMHVLGIDAPMGAMRQRVHDVRGRPVVPTYHPAYLLRSPGEKKECWKDIQLAMQLLGLPAQPAARPAAAENAPRDSAPGS